MVDDVVTMVIFKSQWQQLLMFCFYLSISCIKVRVEAGVGASQFSPTFWCNSRGDSKVLKINANTQQSPCFHIILSLKLFLFCFQPPMMNRNASHASFRDVAVLVWVWPTGSANKHIRAASTSSLFKISVRLLGFFAMQFRCQFCFFYGRSSWFGWSESSRLPPDEVFAGCQLLLCQHQNLND